jgi:dTDP-4-amino-4,6-dideoxygalactose transaminase
MTSRLLPRLFDEQTPAKRRENYRFLLENLEHLVPFPFTTLPEGTSPFAFPIELENATEFLKRLLQLGIKGELFWLFPHPSLPVEDFPKSKSLRNRIIALPVHQELTRSELQQIVDAVYKAAPVRSKPTYIGSTLIP